MNCSRSLTLVLTFVIGLFAAGTVQAAPGDIDRSYGTKGRAYIPFPESGKATAAVAQADGRVVIAGTTGNAVLANGFVARLTKDGKLDRTFGKDGVATVGPAYTVRLASGADGTIYALAASRSHFAYSGDVYAFSSEGSPRSDFGSGGKVDLRQELDGFDANTIAVQGSNVMVIATKTEKDSLQGDAVLTRLTAAGTVDSGFGSAGVVGRRFTFGGGGPSLLVNDDGSILTTLEGVSLFDRNGNSNAYFRLTLPDPNLGWGHLELAASPGGGFSAVMTRVYWGRGATTTYDFYRFRADGAYVPNSQVTVDAEAPVQLTGGSVLVVGSSHPYEDWLKASLLPPQPGTPINIQQSGALSMRALSAAALPDGDAVIVGQITDSVNSVGAIKVSMSNTPRSQYSPGLRRPRSTTYSAGTVKRIEGTVRPANDVKYVQVAILRTNLADMASRKCPWLKKDLVTFKGRFGEGSGPCGRPYWVRAAGRNSWRLKLKRPLEAGTYDVHVRVHWRGGKYNSVSFDEGSYSKFTVEG